MPAGSADLIYIDPPFNSGTARSYRRMKAVRTDADRGGRVGFGGRTYSAVLAERRAYADSFHDFPAFIGPRLEAARRVLADHGSLYFHIDCRESHYCKVLLDDLFGRECFLNEIIWAYDYGGRGKRRWPAKHDTILLYVKNLDTYFFDLDAVERIPYMAPNLVTSEKAARGKSPTDTWWHTIVPTNGKERTGYPTQKPVGIMRRIVAASSRPGDTVLDFFAGSGTTGAACLEMGRRFVLIDNNPDAIEVMERRFAEVEGIEWLGYRPRLKDGEPVHQGSM
jgi:site-specific DNA-methyltransferase (adenine-specific)